MERKLTQLMKIDCKKYSNEVISSIKARVNKEKKDGVLLGLSGGLDSVTALVLATKAVEPKKVWALYLPDRSSEVRFLKISKKITHNLGVNFKVINIEEEVTLQKNIYTSLPIKIINLSPVINKLLLTLFRKFSLFFLKEEPYIFSLKQENHFISKSKLHKIFFSSIKIVEESFNIRHIVRRKILEKFAKEENLLLLGTSNRSEVFVGWFVKNGVDDIENSVFLNLYKSQIFQIASYLKIPDNYIMVSPSPDMFKGITDEDFLGISYEKIDKISFLIENNLNKKLAQKAGISQKNIELVKKMHFFSSYKR